MYMYVWLHVCVSFCVCPCMYVMCRTAHVTVAITHMLIQVEILNPTAILSSLSNGAPLHMVRSYDNYPILIGQSTCSHNSIHV